MPLFARRAAAPTTDAADAALLQMVMNTQAVIHFTPDGTILQANENFLNALEYEADEIIGKHHSLFVEDEFRDTDEYRQFWSRLASGDSFTDNFPRKTKSGGRIWIQATYAPVTDEKGNITRVVKVASDVTARTNAVFSLARGLYHLREGDLTHRVPLAGRAHHGREPRPRAEFRAPRRRAQCACADGVAASERALRARAAAAVGAADGPAQVP